MERVQIKPACFLFSFFVVVLHWGLMKMTTLSIMSSTYKSSLINMLLAPLGEAGPGNTWKSQANIANIANS